MITHTEKGRERETESTSCWEWYRVVADLVDHDPAGERLVGDLYVEASLQTVQSVLLEEIQVVQPRHLHTHTHTLEVIVNAE